MIETDFRESFSIGARTTLCCMDRQREVSRAFTAGRGPLRILYIIRIPPRDATVQASFDFLPACHRAS
ncbi:hypothetical protein, partial [Candidatus Binatus sp.]|uniref:hypothetical protein n=1 Tax=Candidatus Binatus sp. TaxID=2811406 RepID=UPI002FD9D8A8